jgi:hypothetical protein
VIDLEEEMNKRKRVDEETQERRQTGKERETG